MSSIPLNIPLLCVKCETRVLASCFSSSFFSFSLHGHFNYNLYQTIRVALSSAIISNSFRDNSFSSSKSFERWSAWSALIAPVRCYIAGLLFFRQLLVAGFQQLGPDGFFLPGPFSPQAGWHWGRTELSDVSAGAERCYWGLHDDSLTCCFSPDRSVVTQ